MEFYKNNPITIDYEIDSETATVITEEEIAQELGYPDYVVGRLYYQGDVVHSAVSDGGDGHNYRLLGVALAFGGRPEDSSTWQQIDEVQTTTTTVTTTAVTTSFLTDYITNVDISQYPTWKGEGAYVGEIVFDAADGRNYAAAVAIDAADDTTRPSAAVNSNDVDTASRWVLYSVANGFACVDKEVVTGTEYGGDIRMMVRASGISDRVTFFGLRDIKTIEVVVSNGGLRSDPKFIRDTQWLAYAPNAGVTHLNPGTRITSTDTSQSQPAHFIVSNLVPGETYFVVARASATKTDGSSGEWSIWCRYDSDVQNTNTTIVHEFVAVQDWLYARFVLEAGTEKCDVEFLDVYHKHDGANFIEDPLFYRSGNWTSFRVNADIIHLNPGTKIAPINPSNNALTQFDVYGLEIGESYEFTVKAVGWQNSSPNGQWNIWAKTPSPTQTGSKTVTHTFTADATSQHCQIKSVGGACDSVEVESMTVYKVGGGGGIMTADLRYGDENEKLKRTATLSHPSVGGALYTVNLVRKDGKAKVGLITSGSSNYVGSTEADVNVTQHRVVSPERNDYGLVQFGRGAFYKQVTARVWLPGDTGDTVSTLISDAINEPCTWNLNSDDTDYERLIVQGWARKTKIKTTGLPGNDYIQLDLLSLSE